MIGVGDDGKETQSVMGATKNMLLVVKSMGHLI